MRGVMRNTLHFRLCLAPPPQPRERASLASDPRKREREERIGSRHAGSPFQTSQFAENAPDGLLPSGRQECPAMSALRKLHIAHLAEAAPLAIRAALACDT